MRANKNEIGGNSSAPRGREKQVTGTASVSKRGSGLGSGAVGNRKASSTETQRRRTK